MIKERVLKVVANATRKIASTTANSASLNGVYQPKVPKSLKNNSK